MRRTTDAAFLNSVANHEEVRPWLGGEGVIDLAPVLADPMNYGLDGDGGGFVYIHLGGYVYEVHSLFLPEARRGTAKAAQDGLRYMFTATECIEVVTKVPEPNKAAHGLVVRCGFSPMFRREKAWGDDAVEYWSLTADRWVQKSLDCLAEGERFHDLLKGSGGHVDHDDDGPHDHAAGACCLMLKAGKPVKAAWLYNKWCSVTGYRMVHLATQEPPVMDIGTALIGLTPEGELEVLECR